MPARPHAAQADAPTTLLVSWSHADPDWSAEQTAERKRAVLLLARVLRENGVDAELDLYHVHEAVDWTRWGPRMATDSDIVLVVASRAWSDAWEGRGAPTRGAGAAAEASALRSLEAQDRDAFLRKVRIVILPGAGDPEIPTGLHGIPRFHLDSIDDEGVVDLLRDLTGQAEHPKPPLGKLPVLPPSVEGRMGPAPAGPPSGRPGPQPRRPTRTAHQSRRLRPRCGTRNWPDRCWSPGGPTGTRQGRARRPWLCMPRRCPHGGCQPGPSQPCSAPCPTGCGRPGRSTPHPPWRPTTTLTA